MYINVFVVELAPKLLVVEKKTYKSLYMELMLSQNDFMK